MSQLSLLSCIAVAIPAVGKIALKKHRLAPPIGSSTWGRVQRPLKTPPPYANIRLPLAQSKLRPSLEGWDEMPPNPCQPLGKPPSRDFLMPALFHFNRLLTLVIYPSCQKTENTNVKRLFKIKKLRK